MADRFIRTHTRPGCEGMAQWQEGHVFEGEITGHGVVEHGDLFIVHAADSVRRIAPGEAPAKEA